MSSPTHRPNLTRERVLSGAIELADEIGIEAFTIRKLALALGVKPMTIYHHVASKEEILDGMVERVFQRDRAAAARARLARPRSAPAVSPPDRY